MSQDPEQRPATGPGADLERWLDGALPDAERRAFEARAAADPRLAREIELARRVESLLRRRFPVPTAFAPPPAPFAPSAPARPAPPVPRPRPVRAPAGAAPPWRLFGWLAAAAAVLLVVRARTGSDVEPGASVRVADAGRALQRVPPDPVLCPDLASLYRRAADLTTPEPSCAEPADPSSQHLQMALTQRYGERVELCPEASDVLYGPYHLAEWPSGTVLTGYPDGPEGAPAVIVAETDEQLRCCVDIELPVDSRLNLYTWRVGKVLLTEISPHPEPRLLPCFEAVR